tara:strand:- start:943 stop:2406 length:1464 start_codon:yes stop_codon:yes gene_type:complete
MMTKDLTSLSIRESRELLDSGDVTSVELTEAYLERIGNVENKINSFTAVTSDNALIGAKAADEMISRGDQTTLTGIPMQLKDNICTSGITTTCGSKMLENFVPPYDAHVSEKLKKSGAVLLGKGNLDEFAMGSSTENSYSHITKNPWDMTRVPGGSSGGPAAAVSASECLFSLGSDTGGSIRQPASFCGVVGMKPTYGLVSRFGLIAFASSLDQIGPITRDVYDNALVLSSIAGFDKRDSTSIDSIIPNYVEQMNGDIRGMKVGVPVEYLPDSMNPDVKSAVEESIEVLKQLGAVVERTSLPHTTYALAVYYIIAPSEASANLSRYDGVKYGYSDTGATNMIEALESTRSSGFGEEVKRRILLGTYALSSGYYDAYYLKAQKVRTLIINEFNEAFKKFDVLAMPTAPTSAFKIGDKIDDPIQMYLNDIFTIPANIAGIPGISVPTKHVNGLPVGFQFMAGALQEQKLFDAAYAFQQASEWDSGKPSI